MRRVGLALLCAVAVILAACGAHDNEHTSTAASATPSGSQASGSPATASTAKARKHHKRGHAIHIRFARVPISVPAAARVAPFTTPRTLTLPRGWRAQVWARAPGARLMTWTPEGHLLVSQPYGGVVFEVNPGAHPSDPASTDVILRGLTNPQGMAFDRLDGHEVLYLAESNEVDRYDWNNGTLGARTVVIHNLPDTEPSGDDVHRLKTVAIGADHSIYVDIGSSSNATPQNPADRPPRASILRFNSDGSHMLLFATGVRNGDGLSFAPDGTLWTAVNERDSITYPFHRSYGGHADAFGQLMTSYVNNHPPDQIARVTPGRNMGWPFCNPDPDVSPGQASSRFDYANMRFTADALTNPGARRMNCGKLKPIERGIPAHSAPLGFHFLKGSALPAPWNGGAVVGTHGSWDRTPPRAPGVLWMPWSRSQHTLGTAIPIVTGFQTGGRWGRPVDAVPGPDGALYVSDDTAGVVYRIVPTKGF
jgi:glucose/arabinose dehydrogenase